MSKRLLSLMITELNVIRIKCNECHGVAEMTIGGMESAQSISCPSCGKLYRGGKDGLLKVLAKTLRTLPEMLENASIEFVVEEPQ